MGSVTLAICQIPLQVTRFPVTITNPEEHVALVRRCLNIASQRQAKYVVFPEYTFIPDLLGKLYRTRSQKRMIIGGSYQSAEDFNETVIAWRGQLHYYKKRCLSPDETGNRRRSIKAGREQPLIINGPDGEPCAVLTCRDYDDSSLRLARAALPDRRMLSLLFSPSCTDKPDRFCAYAEAVHMERDTMYSVLCNVSSLRVGSPTGDSTVQCGRSAIFGLWDDSTKQDLEEEGLRDRNSQNMILQAARDPCVLIARVAIPYSRPRRGVREFTRNPSRYVILPL